MNDLVKNFKMEGEISYNGTDLYSKEVDVTELRREIGMVFQKPNRSRKVFMKTLRMVYEFTDSATAVTSTASLRKA